ncbi:hypothetical protein JTB14_006296 [Gonioctena quinquepunctata]|nr:hypothetical protein JTB14_006296 [Gonioctena quinquepunctata]
MSTIKVTFADIHDISLKLKNTNDKNIVENVYFLLYGEPPKAKAKYTKTASAYELARMLIKNIVGVLRDKDCTQSHQEEKRPKISELWK